MVGAGVTPADLPLYASHNDLGTAVLLAAMAETGVDRLVLASSMVVYGDGGYSCPEHGEHQPAAASTGRTRGGRLRGRLPGLRRADGVAARRRGRTS